ncbi:unnamed protein product [Hapterophycus canaliculatus]
METSVRGSAKAARVSDMERRNMSMAEGEQCALDDFWGLVANQVEQAEATAAMEREDRRSEHVRARLKKEERYSLWEQEDFKKRGTRSIVRENLEDTARREYLEIFYGAPSADVAINYAWPTRASLSRAARQRSSASFVNDSEASITVTLSGGSGGNIDDDDARSRLSTAQISQDIYNDWSTGGSSAGTAGESSSTRPFHIFRGKKTHRIFPVRDCFVPPRHLSEPTTKNGLVSVHALADAACPADEDTAAGPKFMDTVGAGIPFGLSKAARLPPMVRSSRGRCSAGSVAGWSTAEGSTGGSFSWNKRPLTWQQLLPVSSFERKLAARCEQWSREAEAEAKERAFREQIRTRELLQDLRGLDGGRDDGGGLAYYNNVGVAELTCDQSPPAWGALPSQGNTTRNTNQRRSWSRSPSEGGICREEDGGRVTELIPEREEELLTQMFGILDARGRGEVRLDEVLFYMTENAQVKSVLKQVTLWTLTKTRRWKWVEELLAAQPTRTLTLPALLTFSRSLHEESGVPRKHLRPARKPQRIDEDRKDARSRRLLPADLVDGAEVEALFRKGFEWYRAWIVRCNVDDTFDVRYTRAHLPSLSDTPSEREERATGEQRPEVETSTQTSGSEENWSKSDEETSATEAEEEWKATCDSVARFIGIPPELGETETELLERAFDSIASLTSRPPAGPVPGARQTPIHHGVTAEEASGITITAAATKQTSSPNDGEGKQQALGRSQQQEGAMQPGRPNRGGNVDGAPDAEACSPLRIPAGEIVRVLCAGAIDSFRRASPALSAACIHRVFAEGLEGAARKRRLGESSTGSDRPLVLGRGSSDGGDRDRQRASSGGDGRGWGVSKEEFCDYFEAVTDLVDLNGLSLVPRVHSGLVRPSAVSG